MESAPTDGTKILAICRHDADSYWDKEPGLTITPYSLWSEDEGHVEDGPCVIAWQDGYTEDESGEGWGPWTTMPGWWFETTNCDPPLAANPVGWLPIPPESPPEVTDNDLWEIYDRWDGSPEDWEWFHGVVKDILTKWGWFNLEPIPLSERHPSDEECDGKGRCWYGAPDRPGAVACWDLEPEASTDSTHWLPYWALSSLKGRE